jgi:hypothetical protein
LEETSVQTAALWDLGAFTRANSTSVGMAARDTGIPARTLRRWCAKRGIGRRVGGTWFVDKAALAQMLAGDRKVGQVGHRPIVFSQKSSYVHTQSKVSA